MSGRVVSRTESFHFKCVASVCLALFYLGFGTSRRGFSKMSRGDVLRVALPGFRFALIHCRRLVFPLSVGIYMPLNVHTCVYTDVRMHV